MTEYIQAKGKHLYEGDKIFKFLSFNIPSLLWIEDNTKYHYPIPFTGRYANEYE